ncbi:MAG: prolyl oligopeptidase family serine peptidase [Chitinispirillaceae bacterium]|nr:prolyl oligopeptidase family serine peptidase [Chitinispirillaceae bacterium]
MKIRASVYTVITVLCSLSTAYAQMQYFWNNPASNLPDGCSHHTYHSDLMNTDVGYSIYLPPDYNNGNDQYPVVYSLHGMGGNENSNCQAYSGVLQNGIGADDFPPVIVVFVNGRGNTFYSDAKDGSVKCESSIIEELIPHIDVTYRTRDDCTQRAVEGSSMGGFGALMLGFKHPDVFASIGSYDAALVNWDTLSEQQFDQSIPTQIFGSDEQYFNENSYPFTFARQNEETIKSLGIKVRMITGDNDFQMGPLHNYNLAMRDTLNALGIDLEFKIIPGGTHGQGMNATTIKENLIFHTANFATTGIPRESVPGVHVSISRNDLFTVSTLSSFRLPFTRNGSVGAVTFYTVSGKRLGDMHPDRNGFIDGATMRKRFGTGTCLVKTTR